MTNKLNCNKDGCPGMAHPCDRMSYDQSEWAIKNGSKPSLAIQEALRVECAARQRTIGELEKELLKVYRELVDARRIA